MNRTEVRERLSQVFARTFPDQSIELSDTLTAASVIGWDSITHVDLICAVEEEFSIQFRTAEIASLQNVGELITAIESKFAA